MKFILYSMILVISGQAKDLISGDILANFVKTEQWHCVKDVRVDEKQVQNLTGQQDSNGRILLNSHQRIRSLPYFFTREKYGDVELKLEFMIPKGSNAGVYLMGRYEVQIYDSYGKDKLSFSDMGGIYQRWHETKMKKELRGYEGVPPLINATKSPGEWQSLNINFQAPRFNEKGEKIQNAKFLSVYVNGKIVQKNIEVSGPTRAFPVKGNEKAQGPVCIQGDHGPIAIRSFIIKPLLKSKVLKEKSK